MKPHPFVKAVAALNFENCFNPHSDRCQKFDRPDAPKRRAAILSKILESATSQPVEALWIGRDLGYRGGRRTGLALTDDAHIENHGKRWNLSIERPTYGDVISERTAAVIWDQLNKINSRIFLWNAFPLHPHEPGNPFTNRQHNSHERKAGEKLLKELIVLLRPTRIIAIGNDAAKVAGGVTDDIPVIPVRHPSYGGQNQFLRQIEELYKTL
jgi:hypothetical protein